MFLFFFLIQTFLFHYLMSLFVLICALIFFPFFFKCSNGKYFTNIFVWLFFVSVFVTCMRFRVIQVFGDCVIVLYVVLSTHLRILCSYLNYLIYPTLWLVYVTRICHQYMSGLLQKSLEAKCCLIWIKKSSRIYWVCRNVNEWVCLETYIYVLENVRMLNKFILSLPCSPLCHQQFLLFYCFDIVPVDANWPQSQQGFNAWWGTMYVCMGHKMRQQTLRQHTLCHNNVKNWPATKTFFAHFPLTTTSFKGLGK